MKYRYETHMHTAEGSRCARAAAEEQVRFYKDRGYDGICITDHFLGGNTISTNAAGSEIKAEKYVINTLKRMKE